MTRSRRRATNHNKAQFRSRTRQLGLQYQFRQDPVPESSGFLSPPAPRGSKGSGQSYCVRFNPQNASRPALRRLFFCREGSIGERGSCVSGSTRETAKRGRDQRRAVKRSARIIAMTGHPALTTASRIDVAFGLDLRASGFTNFFGWPFHSPSLTQPRTTLAVGEASGLCSRPAKPAPGPAC